MRFFKYYIALVLVLLLRILSFAHSGTMGFEFAISSGSPEVENYHLFVEDASGSDVDVSISDLSGEVWFQANVVTNEGEYKYVLHPATTVPAGHYVMAVRYQGKIYTKEIEVL